MLKKIIIVIGILSGIGVTVFVGWWIVLLSAFGFFDKDYSVSELKAHFNSQQSEILDLRDYYNSIVPNNRFVEIEFEDKNTLGRFGIMSVDSLTGVTDETLFLDWDLDTDSAKIDSLLKTIGWSASTLKQIKEKLDKANCIQIESGDPTKIGFKRSGMGMYSFNVFKHPINDAMIDLYNDSCTYIYVDENLVLEYGGGAIGPQCFYDLD